MIRLETMINNDKGTETLDTLYRREWSVQYIKTLNNERETKKQTNGRTLNTLNTGGSGESGPPVESLNLLGQFERKVG